MARPTKLADDDVTAFTAAHAGWTRAGDELVKTFSFADFSAALAFAVRVGLAAEKRDHHPILVVTWGKVTARWTTHDCGGLSDRDLELATACDVIFAG